MYFTMNIRNILYEIIYKTISKRYVRLKTILFLKGKYCIKIFSLLEVPFYETNITHRFCEESES